MNAWNYRPGVRALSREDRVNQPVPDGGPSPIDPTPQPQIAPVVTSWAERAAQRARNNRDFLAANPNRRPPRMGRDAYGFANYDPSDPMYDYYMRNEGRARGPNAPPPGTTPTSNADPTPRGKLPGGAFNAAAG